MLRLLNHSERLKVGKRVVSEKKKKPSDGQTFRQTNYTKHQTEDKCTARVATNARYPWSTSEGLTVVQGDKQQAALQHSSTPGDITGLYRASAAASYSASPASSSAAGTDEKSVWLRSPNLLYINPDQLKLDYTVF